MISDTLADAVTEIENYLEAYPMVYDRMRPRIEVLVAQMEEIRTVLDTVDNDAV